MLQADLHALLDHRLHRVQMTPQMTACSAADLGHDAAESNEQEAAVGTPTARAHPTIARSCGIQTFDYPETVRVIGFDHGRHT
jgi:hypothetical protein